MHNTYVSRTEREGGGQAGKLAYIIDKQIDVCLVLSFVFIMVICLIIVAS